jgi:CBS domain-containing protein
MMHKGAEYVAPNATLEQVAKKMRDYDVGALPVCEGGKAIGIVTDRDVTIRGLANGKDISKLTAKDVMSKNVVHCRDTEDAEDALRIMEDNQVRRLPVLDEAQKLVGMVSLGDISHALSQDLTGEVTKAVSAHHR